MSAWFFFGAGVFLLLAAVAMGVMTRRANVRFTRAGVSPMGFGPECFLGACGVGMLVLGATT